MKGQKIGGYIMAQVLQIMDMAIYVLFIKELILSQGSDGRVNYIELCGGVVKISIRGMHIKFLWPNMADMALGNSQDSRLFVMGKMN